LTVFLAVVVVVVRVVVATESVEGVFSVSGSGWIFIVRVDGLQRGTGTCFVACVLVFLVLWRMDVLVEAVVSYRIG
jgi:hypothetical protein